MINHRHITDIANMAGYGATIDIELTDKGIKFSIHGEYEGIGKIGGNVEMTRTEFEMQGKQILDKFGHEASELFDKHLAGRVYK